MDGKEIKGNCYQKLTKPDDSGIKCINARQDVSDT